MFRRLTHHLRCRPKWHMKSYYYSPQGKKSIPRPYMNIQCVAFSASVKKKAVTCDVTKKRRVAPCEGIQESFGFWIQPCGFRIPGMK